MTPKTATFLADRQTSDHIHDLDLGFHCTTLKQCAHRVLERRVSHALLRVRHGALNVVAEIVRVRKIDVSSS